MSPLSGKDNRPPPPPQFQALVRKLIFSTKLECCYLLCVVFKKQSSNTFLNIKLVFTFTTIKKNILGGLLTAWVVFNTIWSIGATCDNDSRVMFDRFLRDKMSEAGHQPLFPEGGLCYDFKLVFLHSVVCVVMSKVVVVSMMEVLPIPLPMESLLRLLGEVGWIISLTIRLQST